MLEETAQQPKKEGQVPLKRWYILRTETGYEQYVQNALQRHIDLHDLQAEFGDIMVPSEEVIEMRAGQKKRVKRKFYPGYVFVEMNMDDQLWHFVKGISHVLGFIGGAPERPAPVSEKEINLILDRVKQGVNKPKPKVLFEPGESVRVISGPFLDFSAVVESVHYEKSRLKVSISIFGRPTLVELEFSQVKKDW